MRTMLRYTIDLLRIELGKCCLASRSKHCLRIDFAILETRAQIREARQHDQETRTQNRELVRRNPETAAHFQEATSHRYPIPPHIQKHTVS